MARTSPAAPSKYFPLVDTLLDPSLSVLIWDRPPANMVEIRESTQITANPSPCTPTMVVMAIRLSTQCPDK
jgi:hypothetical protein